MTSFISERVIEDILTSDKALLAETLSLNASDISLVARQKILTSGKLDLLLLHRDELLLVELKVVPLYGEIINQICRYESDLLQLQDQNRLIKAKIRKIVLVTAASVEGKATCNGRDIEVVVFNPEWILQRYYENFRELSLFLKIQPGDYGVVRLGLITETLRSLGRGASLSEIAIKEGRSEKTIRNRISIACLLNLASGFHGTFYLTELGSKFISAGDEIVDDRLTEGQVTILSEFLRENPFFSSVTYTIFSLVESVFVLSKNSYPVRKEALEDYFVKSVGKTDTWNSQKSKETATYIFSNYACELEFLVKIGNGYFITPKGVQVMLLLQLNRSIKLIESQK